jgi:3D (Asp-Asp-Asp) domain-containing protein
MAGAVALILLVLGAIIGLAFGLLLGRARACFSGAPVVTYAAPALSLPVPVTLTGYSSTPDQTDGDPFVAAWGDDVRVLRARGYVTLAVSRDLEELLPPGTVLLVADRMHHRWVRRVDIHFPSRGEAVKFGVRRGMVMVR